MTLLNNLEKIIDALEGRIHELEEEIKRLKAVKETNNKNDTS